MVGQQILNLSGEGSNPSSPTIKKNRSHRLAVRTLPSHGGSRGSIPLGTTNLYIFNARLNKEIKIIKGRA